MIPKRLTYKDMRNEKIQWYAHIFLTKLRPCQSYTVIHMVPRHLHQQRWRFTASVYKLIAAISFVYIYISEEAHISFRH